MGRIVGGSNGISSGLCSGQSYKQYTSGTHKWIKPAGASVIVFEMIGAGGGGGGAACGEAGGGGGGGGGGAGASDGGGYTGGTGGRGEVRIWAW